MFVCDCICLCLIAYASPEIEFVYVHTLYTNSSKSHFSELLLVEWKLNQLREIFGRVRELKRTKGKRVQEGVEFYI